MPGVSHGRFETIKRKCATLTGAHLCSPPLYPPRFSQLPSPPLPDTRPRRVPFWPPANHVILFLSPVRVPCVCGCGCGCSPRLCCAVSLSQGPRHVHPAHGGREAGLDLQLCGSSGGRGEGGVETIRKFDETKYCPGGSYPQASTALAPLGVPGVVAVTKTGKDAHGDEMVRQASCVCVCASCSSGGGGGAAFCGRAVARLRGKALQLVLSVPRFYCCRGVLSAITLVGFSGVRVPPAGWLLTRQVTQLSFSSDPEHAAGKLGDTTRLFRPPPPSPPTRPRS